MGVKGDKTSQNSVLSAVLMLQKLTVLGDVTSKKMFGGHGVFLNAKMFGMIDSKGRVFFKVNDDHKAKFAFAGSEPHSRMPYMSVSQEVFNNTEQLVDWAKKSTALLKF